MIIENDSLSLQQIADSGQLFRMTAEGEGYRLVAFGRELFLSQSGNKISLDCTEEDFENIWRNYFDLDTDYSRIRAMIGKSGDGYLKAAAEAGRGIRILRQEPFETLISFIISQQMQIPRIREKVELLSEKYGEPLSETAHAFPTADRLAAVGEETLKDLGFGYRARYIDLGAKAVASGSFDLEKIYDMSYEEGLQRLEGLCGVGKKVANCVLLFAYHKVSAFPVDTWIKKIIDENYGGSFDTTAYRGFEGIVQQYMFYYERLRTAKIR